MGENPDLWADENWQNFMEAADVMREVYENRKCLERKVTSTTQVNGKASEDET